MADAHIQDVPIKKNPLEKNSVFQKWYHGFESNFQNLYVSIHTTYPANFIELTDMVQQIRQFKLYF